MQIATDLSLEHSGSSYARITQCQIYLSEQSLSGFIIGFDITVEPTKLVEDKNPLLHQLEVSVHLNEEKQFYLGHLFNGLEEPRRINYKKNWQLKLHLSRESFWLLVEKTHYKKLELYLNANALVSFDRTVRDERGQEFVQHAPVYLHGDKYLSYPHSEWIETLNRIGIERFDLVTLRTSLAVGQLNNVFTQAFDKLREAQDKFNRGDWNATGAACRSAMRTVLSLAPKGGAKP